MKSIFSFLWLCFLAAMFALCIIPNIIAFPNVYADKMIHITAFCLMTLYPVCTWSNPRRIALFAIFLFIGGIGIELAQMFVPGRESSIIDTGADAVGILCGIVIGMLLRSGYNARILAAFLTLLTAMPATAQTNSASQQSWNPAYTPLGVCLGGFKGFHGLSINNVYDDNIFRTPDKTSDLVTVVRPAIFLQSDWNLHSITLGGEGIVGLYKKNPDENYNDYNLFISGQYDLDYETFITGIVKQSRSHEERGSPEDPGGTEPLEYTTTGYALSFTRAPGYIKALFEGKYDQVRFENSTVAGVFVDNSLRDRDEKSLQARLGYEFSPDTQLFINTIYRETDYQTRGILDRSSHGYDLKAGLDFGITGTLKGDIYGGYLHRTYSRNFDDLQNSFFGTRLEWSITDLTFLGLVLNKMVNETSVNGSASNIQTHRRIDIRHALDYNLGVMAYGGVDDFRYGSSPGISERIDRYYYAGTGAEYILGRGFSLGLGYAYSQRVSDINANSFDDNKILLNLKYTH